MGEFQRQHSKVWWASTSFRDDDESVSPDVWPRHRDDHASTNGDDEPPVAAAELTANRGDSSSPSQGSSHGSQDSGFSDSELHNSPDLSAGKRLAPTNSHPPTPATGQKKFKYQLVEFREDFLDDDRGYLETNFDNTPKTIKICRGEEINNQIQNQLELKLPKKISLEPPNDLNGSISSTGSAHTVIEKRKEPESLELDRDGFKIPRCVNLKGSCASLLNFGENPPVSCSTPKAASKPRPQTPTEQFHAQVKEKVSCRSNLATVRKLKLHGLSERRARISPHQKAIYCCGAERDPTTNHQHPVTTWLIELESVYEAEIMTTLQSKSLATDLTRQVTHMASTTSDTIRRLHDTSEIISREFSKLSTCLKCKKFGQIGKIASNLVGHIKGFMADYVETEKIVPQDGELKVLAGTCPVAEACDRLIGLTSGEQFDHEAVEQQRNSLAMEFRAVVDKILLSHVRALVHVLEEPRTELALRTALSALCALGLEGTQLGHLLAQCGGVRALLAVCLEARASAVRVSALRALATVCCLAETIRQFENAGGVEIISDVMSDRKRAEAELTESAAVLAQITAPWVEDNHSIKGLEEYVPSFVSSITYLIDTYKSSECLLLSAAALANLTFMEPRTVWSLLECKTAGILLSAVRRQGPKVSVFIQEQAATVLANMAAVPECRTHLAEHRAVVALLCFLQIQHSPLQQPPEQHAAERVQQKSAIALSRLCSDCTVARQVVELQGVNRLVRLCKEERERNYSDGVLVACLAALRKIVANCGTDPLKDLSATELVEPKLLDSFLLYSSRQESYV